jgi:hypothetical protein
MGGAMSSRDPSHLKRALRWLALVAPAALTIWWFWTRPAPTVSAYDEALDRALAPVMTQREVQAKLGAASPAQARQLARQFAASSIQYLAPRDLELWQSVRLAVARASPAACARLWKGGPTEFLGPAIVGLGDETLDAYTEMLGRALALRLERKPPPEPPAGAVERGLAAISAQLPAEQRARFMTDVERRDLTDARACELFLTVSSGTEKLEPALRSELLRALAKELPLAPP